MISIIAALMLGSSPSLNHDETAIYCQALNAYHEARGEDEQGQKGVMWVVKNRVEDSRWPNNPCGVIYQWRQFSWTQDSIPDTPLDTPEDKKKFERLLELATFVHYGMGDDPTNGATHYYAYNVVNPKWAKSDHAIETAMLGNHRFMDL